MGIRNSLESIIITDSTTGSNIDIIKDKKYDDDITLLMIMQRIKEDYKSDRHGIHIRYGIEP